jgi:hypothetical protein
MDRAWNRVSIRYRLAAVFQRLIGLADDPTDDDDVRLRKRVGVVAGHIATGRAIERREQHICHSRMANRRRH